jgi:hypothetical protein
LFLPVIMWLLQAFPRLTLPEPESRMRFFAPLWVFIFGIVRLLPLRAGLTGDRHSGDRHSGDRH